MMDHLKGLFLQLKQAGQKALTFLVNAGIVDSGAFGNQVAENIYRQVFRMVRIYSVVCLGILIVILQMKNLLQQHFWSGDNPYYKVLHFLDQGRFLIPFVLYVLGIIIIFSLAFRKTVHYLDTALEAAGEVADDKEELIELPKEFKEIETLFNTVKLKIRDNDRMAREAEQRKNDLVVYLAHDLKTPLTSVIGYLTLLEDEKELPPALREKYLGIAVDKAERLEDLINEFFEITRFNLTDIELEMSRISLSRLLDQVVYEFSPMFKERNLSCKVECPADLFYYCDANKMQRVFDNLLRNAVNYCYPDTEISITVKADDTGIALTFLNHGSTIPPEKLNRLFEQFFRLDDSRGSASGGAGLGLAIAKEIVEKHGGRMLGFDLISCPREIIICPGIDRALFPGSAIIPVASVRSVKPEFEKRSIVRDKFIYLAMVRLHIAVASIFGVVPVPRGKINAEFQPVFTACFREFSHHISLSVFPWRVLDAVFGSLGGEQAEAVMMLGRQDDALESHPLEDADPLGAVQILRIESGSRSIAIAPLEIIECIKSEMDKGIAFCLMPVDLVPGRDRVHRLRRRDIL